MESKKGTKRSSSIDWELQYSDDPGSVLGKSMGMSKHLKVPKIDRIVEDMPESNKLLYMHNV